jgi:hypothetical protein
MSDTAIMPLISGNEHLPLANQLKTNNFIKNEINFTPQSDCPSSGFLGQQAA